MYFAGLVVRELRWVRRVGIVVTVFESVVAVENGEQRRS